MEFFLENRVRLAITEIRKENLDISTRTQILYVNVELDNTTAYITVLINAPEDALTDDYVESGESAIFEAITRYNIESMHLKLRVIPVNILEYESITTP